MTHTLIQNMHVTIVIAMRLTVLISSCHHKMILFQILSFRHTDRVLEQVKFVQHQSVPDQSKLVLIMENWWWLNNQLI